METRFDGLSEFLSRRGRTRILERLLEELGTYQSVARKLDVNRATVHRWATEKRVHPSNRSTDELLNLLEEVDPGSLRTILVEEANTFLEILWGRIGNLNSEVPTKSILLSPEAGV
ncbi:hypothetical protein AKJ41_01045 [candidate division MSBL1 archaeon SCGC-AAA259O05]|uniref:Uncharacterized protein n=1 Tax=candidate division MSBL1 archaeon SCGC-AAA259O05 TaxID=1698271 RepID=A0A133V536_9EURY|nr:hypothetical protein AKJ41_01045 [candidate division MSBL1 archaeon SCGC-AAA259O05]